MDRRNKTTRAFALLASGSALAMVASAGAAAEEGVAPEAQDVPLQIEGQTVSVAVDASSLRDDLDGARAGINVRGADQTNKADSHDNSARDKGDSVKQSPLHTGANEGDSV